MKRYKPLFLFIPALYLLLPILSFAQMTWTCACSSAQWSARSGHTSVVFDNKMWVIGGGMVPYAEDDVWYSSDGVYWTQTTDSAGWSVRGSHTSVVFDNKMWVLGGHVIGVGSRNDVWYSADGSNWTCAIDSVGWSARYDHTSFVYDNKIWVVGGFTNDVWYSTDGVNWIQATDSAGWSARFGHSSVIFDDRMWVMGGWDGADRNDVWYSNGLGIEEHSTPYAQTITPNITIVRGVLFLSPASSIGRQASNILLDITGRKVADLKAGANNIRHLATGVYFIRRNFNKRVLKIIVTK